MEISQLINESKILTEWIRETLHGLEVQGDIRSRVALSCLDIVLDHREAIVLLVSRKLYGSAFALVRSVFESYIRGVWLHLCATETEIERFTRDKLKKEFNELIQEIENIKGYDSGLLSRVKIRTWKAMNSYTHSGFQHVMRRMTQDTIEPKYHEGAIIEVLNFANSIGLLSVLQMVYLSNNQQLPMTILGKTEEFMNTLGTEDVV